MPVLGGVALGSSGTADTTKGCSRNLWRTCPTTEELKVGPKAGYECFDHFSWGGLTTSATTEAALIGTGWSAFGSSGATQLFGTEAGGTLACVEATDNEACFVRGEAHAFQISSLLGELWYETRIKVSAITDDQIGFICGLVDTTALTVNIPLSTANPPVLDGCNFVGFRGPEEDAGLVASCYIADTVTPVEVQADIHQFVADTYVKLGMHFNPNKAGVATLEFYVNGVLQSSTKTVPNATGTDFPADVRLAPMFGHKLGASTSSTTTCDWVRCVQLFT